MNCVMKILFTLNTFKDKVQQLLNSYRIYKLSNPVKFDLRFYL